VLFYLQRLSGEEDSEAAREVSRVLRQIEHALDTQQYDLFSVFWGDRGWWWGMLSGLIRLEGRV